MLIRRDIALLPAISQLTMTGDTGLGKDQGDFPS